MLPAVSLYKTSHCFSGGFMKRLMALLFALVLTASADVVSASSTACANNSSGELKVQTCSVGSNTGCQKKETCISLGGAAESDLTALQTQVSAQATTIASLQSLVTALQTTITGLQTKLASTAAQNAFALGDYVSVDTVDPTVKGVKAPNIIFSGANIHILSGSGTTIDSTGLGNLLIGYDNDAVNKLVVDAKRFGSHNLIVGDQNTFISSGGLVAGNFNAISANYTSVSGGQGNTASGPSASVSGGAGNTASGLSASIGGGVDNLASGDESSVMGGQSNTASELLSTVSGGNNNLASGVIGTVSGGEDNTASAFGATVAGGRSETASVKDHTQVGPSDFAP
jgi:hypothetical protein